MKLRSEAMCTSSRCPSSEVPRYQGMCTDGSTTLSPSSADTGMKLRSVTLSLLANALNSSLISMNRSSDQSTRSILFTHKTMCAMPSNDDRKACLRVCSSTPLRASMRTSATSAVDAPVTMLRVYCTCPGVSAMMNLRLGVAKYRYATSMVMPCSRSARRPSVSSARLAYSSPRSELVRSIDSIWSVKMLFESYNSRPISVDFPSSTLPAVANRSNSFRPRRTGSPMISSWSTVIRSILLSCDLPYRTPRFGRRLGLHRVR